MAVDEQTAKDKPFEFQPTGKECAPRPTESFVTPVWGRVQTFAKRTATKGGEAELSYDMRERTTGIHTYIHTVQRIMGGSEIRRWRHRIGVA